MRNVSEYWALALVLLPVLASWLVVVAEILLARVRYEIKRRY